MLRRINKVREVPVSARVDRNVHGASFLYVWPESGILSLKVQQGIRVLALRGAEEWSRNGRESYSNTRPDSQAYVSAK